MFSRPPLGSTAIFGIPWYSLLIVSAVILGILLAQREEKRLKLPKDTILDFALWAIPLAIVGARIYYVIFRWDLFQDQPLRIFAIWEGGIAIYGGILGGLLAAWLLSRRRKISMLTLLDACAPSLVLGQAIGRWGNYANMEAYGARITNPAFQFF
ncbi:MAG: prolipoprotein diacylglyceryl transferase, partial [Clostridia bacterium]